MYFELKAIIDRLLKKDLLDQADLFTLGEYLDDLEAVAATRTLATKSRKAIRRCVEYYILNGMGPETAITCGRSWALSDLREQVLVRMECQYPSRVISDTTACARVSA